MPPKITMTNHNAKISLDSYLYLRRLTKSPMGISFFTFTFTFLFFILSCQLKSIFYYDAVAAHTAVRATKILPFSSVFGSPVISSPSYYFPCQSKSLPCFTSPLSSSGFSSFLVHNSKSYKVNANKEKLNLNDFFARYNNQASQDWNSAKIITKSIVFHQGQNQIEKGPKNRFFINNPLKSSEVEDSDNNNSSMSSKTPKNPNQRTKADSSHLNGRSKSMTVESVDPQTNSEEQKQKNLQSTKNTKNQGVNKNLWNIPNILTILRVVAIPFLMLFFFQGSYLLSAFIFATASFTDYLDGYLARKWKIVSNFGAFLDPVADKLMVATCLILLSGVSNNFYVTLFTSIILMREITISALREWMASCQIRNVVAVGWWGKVKTATTMIALIFCLLSPPKVKVVAGSVPLEFTGSFFGEANPLGQFGMVLFAISTILTCTSAWGYLKAAAPYLLK